MSSKRKSRKSRKSTGPALVMIAVVLLTAHAVGATGMAWLVGGIVGGALLFRLVGRGRRPGTRGVRYARHLRVFPFVKLNISRSPTKGWSHSWTVKIGPWSWNSRTGRARANLPGDFYWQ